MMKREIASKLNELTPEQLQELIFLMASAVKPQPKKFLTSKEAGKFLGKSENAMRIMATRDQIPSYKKGKLLRFLESDLIEWVESGRRRTVSELTKGIESDLIFKRRAN